jgi:YD repeat-containing protein
MKRLYFKKRLVPSIVAICCLTFIGFSCKKDETPETKLHLLNVVRTDWQGSKEVAVYNYDKMNRLRDIKHTDETDYIEIFNYSPDGKLSSYESDFDHRYRESTFQYDGEKVDYAVFNYANNEHVQMSDTAFYSYGPDGKISHMVFRNNYIYSELNYICDEKGRVISYTGSGGTAVFLWDDAGNLVKRTDKGFTSETGYYEIETDFKYDSGNNFNLSIPYPAEFLFIRSLSPSPNFSRNNCVSENLYDNSWLGRGPAVFSEYNSAGYPTKIISGETTFILTYGEYIP